MRALMLSKALVVGAYQRKAELMAAEPDLDLTVAVPPRWRDGARWQPLERAHVAGYDLVSTPIFRPGDFHLHAYPRFGELLDRVRPDLVHLDEEPYNLATFLALHAARRRGARTLFFTWQNLARRYPPPFSWFERYVHRHADAAIAGSRAAADTLRAKGFAGPVWVLPQFGVDAERFQPATSLDPTSADERFRPAASLDPTSAAERLSPTSPLGSTNSPGSAPLRIGYAGRLVAAKGVDLLLEAVARLPAQQAWRLEILGDGPERAPLAARAAALGVAGQVLFQPWAASTAMPAFYQGLDVLVLPSRSTPSWIEQFGRVLIEAMACGVVCVGSDSGEIPHVIGDAGVVFREGDAAELAGILAGLAENPGRRAALGAAGRTRVLDHFTMAHVAAETVAIYRTIVARGPYPA